MILDSAREGFSSNQTADPPLRGAVPAVPQLVVTACLHAGSGTYGIHLRGGYICAVSHSGLAEGDLVQMGQVSGLSGLSDPGWPSGHYLAPLVASVPGSTIREVASSSPLDGDHDRCQPDRLAGGGCSGPSVAQGRWTPEESRISINVLELRAIRLCLSIWTQWLHSRQVRIQSDNATAVAYVNHLRID